MICQMLHTRSGGLLSIDSSILRREVLALGAQQCSWHELLHVLALQVTRFSHGHGQPAPAASVDTLVMDSA